jgi:hypothetical protein
MRCSYRLLENKFQDVGETLILNIEMHVSYISFVFSMYSVSGALVGLMNGSSQWQCVNWEVVVMKCRQPDQLQIPV